MAMCTQIMHYAVFVSLWVRVMIIVLFYEWWQNKIKFLQYSANQTTIKLISVTPSINSEYNHYFNFFKKKKT